MISSLLFTTLVAKEPILGPVCLPGTSTHFQSAVKQVCELTLENNFKEASAILGRLPHNKISYRVDWTGVSASKKTTFELGMKEAMAEIKGKIQGLDFTPVSKGEDILFSFTEKLPVSKETGVPQGLVMFPSLSPSEPAIEAVIGLKRLNTETSIEKGHVANETFFVIGQYLGLAQTPGIFSISKRTDSMATTPNNIDGRESRIIRENLKLAEELRASVAKKQQLVPANPVASLDTKTLDTGEVAQGKVSDLQIGIYNRGNVPLTFSIIPDCSCFRLFAEPTVEPGSSGTIRVFMDSSSFIGQQHKQLFIYTNDPSNPLIIVPVNSYVRPAYRFINDGPENEVYYLDENGARATVFLTVDEGQDIKPHSIKIIGASGIAEFEPWEGEIADPLMNEPPSKKKGYKITALISPDGIKGKTNATISVLTNNEGFKNLNYNLSIQKGVSFSPSVIYLGEIQNQVTRAYTILSQPHRPFKITKIESNNKNITASYEPLPNEQYKVVVEYDGKGLAGNFSSSIVIHTDSKDSPVIEIPIQGLIK